MGPQPTEGDQWKKLDISCEYGLAPTTDGQTPPDCSSCFPKTTLSNSMDPLADPLSTWDLGH